MKKERPSEPGAPTLPCVEPLKKKGLLLSWLRRDSSARRDEPSSPQTLAPVSSSIEESAGEFRKSPDAEESSPPYSPSPPDGTGVVETPQHFFLRLKASLHRSSSRLTQGIVTLFTKRRLDRVALEELEELLISADLGITTSANLIANLASMNFNKEVNPVEIRSLLATHIARILESVEKPLSINHTAKPHVILVVGVNGSGKTTTIGKMARQFRAEGLKVSLAAGDTFRAAAVEQLSVWGERCDCPVIARATGADAAGLAFDALNESMSRGDDVLLVDTAGRLHNKGHLIDELEKIIRVLQKREPAAPHTGLLVLDATIGQNAHMQVDVFRQLPHINSLAVTKLDGTARGGVLVALAEKFQLPVHYVGIGEQVEDLRPFSAHAFAQGLLGFDV